MFPFNYTEKRFGQPKSEDGNALGLKTQQSSPSGKETNVFIDGSQPVKVEKGIEVAESEDVHPQRKKNRTKKVSADTPIKGQRQAPNPLNEGKRARVIVRNLAFKVSKHLFELYLFGIRNASEKFLSKI